MSRRAPMLAWTLRERRLPATLWSLGALALTLPILAIWPTLRESPELRDFLDRLPRFLLHLIGVDPERFFSGAGFAEAQFLTILGPLIMALWCISLGATATAADEEAGRLEVLLGHPLSLRSLLLQRFVAMVVLALPVAAGFGLSLTIGTLAFDMGLEARGILGVVLALWLVGLGYGSFAVAAGAIFGSAGTAGFSAALFVLLSFLLVGLGPLLAPIQALSRCLPHHWYLSGETLYRGPGPAQLVQLAFVVVPLALALALIGRRDLGRPVFSAVKWWRRRGGNARPRGPVHARLWLERPADLCWGAAMVLVTIVVVGLWPLLRDDIDVLGGILERVPREVFQAFGVKDPATLLTAGGFVASRVHAGICMILLLVYAIGRATRVVAGDEGAGRLELLLAAPLGRGAWLGRQARALGLEVTVLVALPTLVLLVADPVLGLGIGTGRILAGFVSFTVFGLAMAGLTLALAGLGLGSARSRGLVRRSSSSASSSTSSARCCRPGPGCAGCRPWPGTSRTPRP
ncbi:MAG: ABC transporter permease subunit [Planctomycetota bacterium]